MFKYLQETSTFAHVEGSCPENITVVIIGFFSLFLITLQISQYTAKFINFIAIPLCYVRYMPLLQGRI